MEFSNIMGMAFSVLTFLHRDLQVIACKGEIFLFQMVDDICPLLFLLLLETAMLAIYD